MKKAMEIVENKAQPKKVDEKNAGKHIFNDMNDAGDATATADVHEKIGGNHDWLPQYMTLS